MSALTARIVRPRATRWDIAACALVASVLAGFAVSRSPFYAIGGLVGCAILFLAVRHLAASVAILIFTALLQEAPSLSGKEVTGVKVIGAITAIAWIARLGSGRIRYGASDPPARRARMAAAALALWTLMSAAWAVNASIGLSEAFRLLQGILLLFIAYSAIERTRDVWTMVVGLVAGGVATTALGAARGFSAPAVYNQWGEMVDRRFGGLAGDPNELAAQLVPALVLCAIVAIAPGKPKIRLLAAAAAVVLLSGIAGAASRGAVVGLAAALLLAPVLLRGMRLRTFVAAGAVASLFAALVVLIAPPALAHRLHVFSDGGTGRTDLWRVGLGVVKDHPLTGAGAGNFPLVAPHYAGKVFVRRPDLVFTQPHVVHNTFLQFFVDTGLVGGVLALIIFVAAVRSAVAAARLNRVATDGVLARATLIAVTAYLASLMFISGSHEKPLWVLLAISLRMPSLLANREVGAA